MPYHLCWFQRGDQVLLEMTQDTDALVKDVQSKFPGARLRSASPPLDRATALWGREMHTWGIQHNVLVEYPGGPVPGAPDYNLPVVPLPTYQVLACNKASFCAPVVMQGDLRANIAEILEELPVDDVRLIGCADTLSGIDEITGSEYPERFYSVILGLDVGINFIGITDTLGALAERFHREQGASITIFHHVSVWRGEQAAMDDCRAQAQRLAMQGFAPLKESAVLAGRRSVGGVQ